VICSPEELEIKLFFLRKKSSKAEQRRLAAEAEAKRKEYACQDADAKAECEVALALLHQQGSAGGLLTHYVCKTLDMLELQSTHGRPQNITHQQ
jgi:hypothetical protein